MEVREIANVLLEAFDSGRGEVKAEVSVGPQKAVIGIRDVERSPHDIELRFMLSVLSDGEGLITLDEGVGVWGVGTGPQLLFNMQALRKAVGEELAVKIESILKEALKVFADKYGYSLASGMSISTDGDLEHNKPLSEGAKALWQSFKEGASCYLLFWEGTTIALEGLEGDSILLKVETMDFGEALVEAQIVDGQAKLLVKEGYEEIFMKLPELEEVVEYISLRVWEELEADRAKELRNVLEEAIVKELGWEEKKPSKNRNMRMRR